MTVSADTEQSIQAETNLRLPRERLRNVMLLIAGIILFLVGAYALKVYSYPLYHTFIELAAIGTGVAIFAIGWNTWAYTRNSSLLTLAVASIGIGVIDILHTLTFKGVIVLPHLEPGMPTQFWIAGRYLEAISLLLAGYFLISRRTVRPGLLLIGYLVVTAALVFAIIPLKVFPACMVVIDGKTTLLPFKIISEYLICLILATAAILFWRGRDQMDRFILNCILLALGLKIISELSFTLYSDPFGPMNYIGHVFRAFATVSIYFAFVHGSLRTPYSTIFRELALSHEQLQDELTERKMIEEALEKEHAYLAAAIDLLPLPLYFISQNGEVTVQNRALHNLLRQAGHTQVTEMQLLDAVSQAPLPRDAWPRQRALRGEVITGQELLLASEGNDIPVITHAAPITLDDQVVAAVVVVEDATSLKEADRAKDQFLAMVSHDLQTPLACILLWSKLALQKDDPEFMQQAMEVILRNANAQQNLLEDLLDMSRLLHCKIAIAPKLVDLGHQAQHAYENFSHQAQEQNISLNIQTCDDPLPVMADPYRLQQCIGNLIQNSLKFTPSGGAITITCAHRDGQAILAVTDTGQGIASEDLDAIFIPFRQARNTGKGKKGLGLGLALARGILELHCGTISVESPGKSLGSTFTIALPLADPTVGFPPSTTLQDEDQLAVFEE